MLGNRHRARVLQALAVLVAGCGNQDVVVPAECLDGSDALSAALTRAPAEVRLGDRVPISECFKAAAEPADVQNLGATVLATTHRLTLQVRREPRSQSAVELGYLTGAIRRSSRTDSGVHYETERRIEQELAGVPTGTPEFRRGLAAGRRSG
jgi:hypothetical protein